MLFPLRLVLASIEVPEIALGEADGIRYHCGLGAMSSSASCWRREGA